MILILNLESHFSAYACKHNIVTFIVLFVMTRLLVFVVMFDSPVSVFSYG